MPTKLVILWSQPDDVEGFEDHYRDVHMPIVERYPAVLRLEATRLVDAPFGGEVPAYLVLTVECATEDDLHTLIKSEPFMESGADAREIGKRFGARVTILRGEDYL
jgi:uncharacterized protein (TIGR02118 family)